MPSSVSPPPPCPSGLPSTSSPHRQALKSLKPLKLNCKFDVIFRLAGVFADATFGNALKADLNNNDDSKRSLKELSATNAANIWTVLGLDDPKCDANNDGTVKGDELKCLNWAWKAFVPS